MTVEDKSETEIIKWVPETFQKTKGVTRSGAARRAIAEELSYRGLTFLGELGLKAAQALMKSEEISLPNGKILTSPQPCPICGSYNGKMYKDAARLALSAVFCVGADDPTAPEAEYIFVSAGARESCLAKYVLPLKIRNADALRRIYPQSWFTRTAGESSQEEEASADESSQVKSYIFPVVVEPDEDAWRAYVPELEEKGAATWGHTKAEALRNIQEVAQMVIEVLIEDGESLPPSVTVSDEPVVAVSIG